MWKNLSGSYDILQERPYPVSKVPVYENPNVLAKTSQVWQQPGETMKQMAVASIKEAFNSALPCKAFEQLLDDQPQLVNEVGESVCVRLEHIQMHDHSLD